MDALPAWNTLALVATLLQGVATRAISARITIRRAGINGHIALISSVATAAQTGHIFIARFIFAHGSGGAGIVSTVTSLLLAIDAGVTSWTVAAVALRKILALTTIVTGLRGALIDVLFATTTGESGWTEALDVVTHGHTESSMLASTLATNHRFALFPSLGGSCIGSHVTRTLVAALCSGGSLVMMQWAGRARG